VHKIIINLKELQLVNCGLVKKFKLVANLSRAGHVSCRTIRRLTATRLWLSGDTTLEQFRSSIIPTIKGLACVKILKNVFTRKKRNMYSSVEERESKDATLLDIKGEESNP